ncbi:MAG: sulfatase, partial [Verrucomicrobiales bacterium VVV1]
MNPNPFLDMTRRQFLGRASTGIGAAALASLLNPQLSAAQGSAGIPHFAPKAKRVIWLTQAGAPSQLDLFDYKPGLSGMFDKDLPDSVRNGQRVTGMTSGQARFPIAPSVFSFKQYGQAGHWMSELLPHTSRLADELCIIRSMHTEAINHDPAMTMLQTGSQVAGRPSFGSWLSYGLGSENADLPAFVVMVSRPSGKGNAQPLHERMWGSGFLSPRFQGVRFSAGKDPVLFLANSPGITRERRRAMLDDLAGLNQIKLDDYQDPEIQARIDQYEMAFRMQASVPELADLSKEPASVFERYGPESRKPGTYAANCVLARRLAERGVRFIQLYHKDWDHHGDIKQGIVYKAEEIDRACMALLTDLKQRDLLKDTLVIWGGEFGRTPMSQGNGRDHHNKG